MTEEFTERTGVVKVLHGVVKIVDSNLLLFVVGAAMLFYGLWHFAMAAGCLLIGEGVRLLYPYTVSRVLVCTAYCLASLALSIAGFTAMAGS